MLNAPHVYVESDLADEQTLAEYRRDLEAERAAEDKARRHARLEDWSWPAIFVGGRRSYRS